MAKILLIDDDDQVREALTQILERAGHEVVEASDGKFGLSLYESSSTDIVITDILMPDVGGIDTISLLRNQSPDVRIIAISGGDVARDPETCLEYARRIGADQVLAKPVRKDELLASVNVMLQGA